MALNSTMYKATLHISDMDRHYYQEHFLTLAKHPSETEERLMVRLLAFALYADEALEFGKGIGAIEEEPALWRKNLTGEIELWIEVGLPDERIIRKACGKSKQVVVINYGKNNANEIWWNQNQAELIQKPNLTVLPLDENATQALAALASRNMQIACSIEDSQILISSEAVTITIIPIVKIKRDRY